LPPAQCITIAAEMTEAAEWLKLFDAVNRDAEQLASEAREHEKRGGPTTRARMQLQKKLEHVRQDVSQLNKSLNSIAEDPMRYRIGEGEVARRQGLMTNVQKLLDTIGELVAPGAVRQGRRQNREVEETEDTKNMSNSDIYQAQTTARQNQEMQLDGILVGVQKLKHMGGDINKELDLQTRLLDELDSAVQNTDNRLLSNIKNVEEVEEKEGGNAGICCMCILMILMVFFLASNLPCHIFNSKKC